MNKITRYGWMLALAVLFFLGTSSAQSASNSTNHSLTVLPRPNTTIQNSTHQPPILPPSDANLSSNYTTSNSSAAAANSTSGSNASSSNPVAAFFSGIANFFTKLFS